MKVREAFILPAFSFTDRYMGFDLSIITNGDTASLSEDVLISFITPITFPFLLPFISNFFPTGSFQFRNFTIDSLITTASVVSVGISGEKYLPATIEIL